MGIERNIQSWRRDLEEREGVRADHADELEDHLREEVAHLQKAALSEDEIFRIAVERLGRPAAIAAELERADSAGVWRKRWMWMLVGYVVLYWTTYAIAVVDMLSQWFSRSLSQTGVRCVSLGTNALATIAVILVARSITRRAGA